MPYVEIYKLQNDGSQTVLATCRLAGEEVVCEGDDVFVTNLKEQGIRNYTDEAGDKLFPKDGLKFLENLKYYFKSGYLNASEVKEN